MAAIDISRKYLEEDKDIAATLRELKKQQTGFPSEAANRLFYRFNYIAHLANAGHLNRNYLSLQIGCDMKDTYDSYQRLNSKLATGRAGFTADNVEELKQYISKSDPCLTEGPSG